MVWICSKCEKGKHVDCESTWQCDWECNVNSGADVTKKRLAIGGGAALVVGGLALTICTGGLGAIFVGGAMLGAGISSTWTGAEKAIRNERINGTSYVADVAFGAVTGVATGGVGAVGETVAANVVKQGAKEVAKAGVKKLAVRAATGAVAGVASKALDEVKQCLKAEKKWSDYGKSFDKDGNTNGTAAAWVTGAFVGGLGGVGSNISSNLSKQATSGVVKSIARVTVSGTTAAVSDATIQSVNIAVGNQDEYDLQRTVTSATSSIVMAAAQEGTKSAIYRSQGGKDSMLNDRANRKIIKETVPEQDRQAVLEGYDQLKKIPQLKLDDEALKAFAVTNGKIREDHQRSVIQDYDNRIKSETVLKQTALDAKDYSATQQYTKNVENLVAQKRADMKSFQAMKPVYQKSDITHMNNQNAHFLTGDKVQQVAMDVKPSADAPRGLTRATFDYNVNDQGRGLFRYADYNNKHQYEHMAGYGEGDHRFSRFHENQDNILRAKDEAMNNLIRNLAFTLQDKKQKNVTDDFCFVKHFIFINKVVLNLFIL